MVVDAVVEQEEPANIVEKNMGSKSKPLFVPAEFAIPSELLTKKFKLQMLPVGDVEKDFIIAGVRSPIAPIGDKSATGRHGIGHE